MKVNETFVLGTAVGMFGVLPRVGRAYVITNTQASQLKRKIVEHMAVHQPRRGLVASA